MLDDFLGSKRSLDWCVQFWSVLVLSFVCALIATWVCKAIALRFNIVDKPDGLVKTHKTPVAYLGGVGVLIGLFIGILCGVYLTIGRTGLPVIMQRLFCVIMGAAISCFVGVIDDILNISPAKKVFGHIYDQMIDRGISLKRTVGICYVLAGLYAFASILISMIRTRYAFIACTAIFLVSFLVVWRLGFLKMEGLRGAVHKKA